MLNHLIDKKLWAYLERKESYYFGFEDFYRNDKTYKDDIRTIRIHVLNWSVQSEGSGIEYMPSEHISFLYTTTQFFNREFFDLLNNKIELYRGLHDLKDHIFKKIVKEGVITTRKFSSFSASGNTADRFGSRRGGNSLTFTVDFDTQDIIFSYKDWLISSQDEREYVIYNPDQKTYTLKDIKIPPSKHQLDSL